MTLTKAIEAARAALGEADHHISIDIMFGKNKLTDRLVRIKQALAALPDQPPLTEDEIFKLIEESIEHCEDWNDAGKAIIRALKVANVLFVKED